MVNGGGIAGDGSGGVYAWYPLNSDNDDSSTTIAPSGINGPGRWKLSAGRGLTGSPGPQGQPGGPGPVGGNVMAIGAFQSASGTIIPAGANLVRTSSFAAGSSTGQGDYVYDPIVKAAFSSTYLRASFLASDGRGFRLAGDTISVEQFGAIGDNVANDQPAIQACLDYAAAVGIKHVQFGHDAYALWCPLRTTTAYTDYNTDGIPMVVRSSMLMEPKGSHTTLNFLSHEGLDRTTHWQTPPIPGTNLWRGGGIYIVGDASQPAAGTPLKIEYFAMRNMKLDGGIQMTGYRGDPNGNAGKGWDQTDKGFRFQDQFAGDFYLENVEITRFSGELLYGAGQTRSMTTTNCWLHNTDGDAYNWANNCRMLDIGSRWGEAYQPIEGCAGLGIRLVKTEMYDCYTGGGIAGGFIGGARDSSGALLPNTTYGEFYVPVGIDIPWIDLDDVTIRNCNGAAFSIGSYTRGTINTVDASVTITAQQRVIDTVDLTINAVADKINFGTALYMSGPQTDTTPYNNSSRYFQRPNNISVKVNCGRTANATANNIAIQQPVTWDGLYGDNVWVVLDNCVTARGPTAGNQTTPSLPGIKLNRFKSISGSTVSASTSMATVGGNNNIRFTGPIVSFGAGASTAGDYQVTLDTVGFADQQEVTVYFYGGGSTMTFKNGQGVRLLLSQIPAGGGGNSSATFTLANNAKAVFRYDLSRTEWDFIGSTAYAY